VAVGLAAVVLVAAAMADARSTIFAKPTKYRTVPQAACGRSMFFPRGLPGRLVPAPGHPGLSAQSTSRWSAVVTWRLSRSAPSKCKTIALLISLGNYADWLPTTKEVRPRRRYSGTIRLSVSSTEPPSDVVIASAFGPKYRGRSRVDGVLIRR
jgi:hypothetical protein